MISEDLDGMLGEGNGTPLQYSCLENPMDRGAWQAAVYGVAKSQTRLSDFTSTFHFHALEKGMATHSSVLAWRIPGAVEPSRLPSMGPHSRTQLKRLSSSSSNHHYTVILIILLESSMQHFSFKLQCIQPLLCLIYTNGLSRTHGVLLPSFNNQETGAQEVG